ncbi:hypothetical protein [Brumimicrobium mesophilum]|uniref:hypothetical protein n=1 Tax=Brumimicrobium mesophilum TaxID=392717 RepID=UPI000D141B2D|nr:hypothetical protein [Brumimicrobium mesophilum]
MKNLRLSLTFILISIFSNSIYSQEWKTLDKEGFSIDYPESWVLNEAGTMGTIFILFSPLSDEKDEFRENINLVTEDISAYDIDMDQYIEISTSQLKKYINNGKVIESERIDNGDLTFHKLIFSGEQGQFDLIFEVYTFLLDGTAYVLTFTTEKDQFKEFKEVGEQILDSFLLN